MTDPIYTLKAIHRKPAGVTEPFTSRPILSLREWDLLRPANRRSKPFVPFHNLSPSPQSAIHFQSHDPVIANGPLSTETRICVFLSLNPRRAPVRLRWMRLGVKRASRAGRISVLEKQLISLFFIQKKSKSTFFLPHW